MKRLNHTCVYIYIYMITTDKNDLRITEIIITDES